MKCNDRWGDGSNTTVSAFPATYATTTSLTALRKEMGFRTILRSAPAYAASITTSVTGTPCGGSPLGIPPPTHGWANRFVYYCPTGTAPTDCAQSLQLTVVLGEGEEIEIFNGSAFPLSVAGPAAGCSGPAAGVVYWDDTDAAQNRTYTLGGDVVGLGTKIVPNGAAVIKQVNSSSIASTSATKALAVLIGALQT